MPLDIEKRRAYMKAYRETNKERLRESGLAYNRINRAKRRAFYLANRERRIAQMREWQKAHPDLVRETTKRFRERNPGYCAKWNQENVSSEVRRARYTKWAKSHPDQVRSNNRLRRARERGAEGRHTVDDISAILKTQNGLCVTCGKDISCQYTVDHIVSLKKRGSNNPDNIQLLCRPCNSSKWAHDLGEWSAKKGRLSAKVAS